MNFFRCKCLRPSTQGDTPVRSKNSSGAEKHGDGEGSSLRMRKLSAPPSSEPAAKAMMAEEVNMMQFFKGEELVTFNAFLKDEDFVTIHEFLKEEEEEDPAWSAREKIPLPEPKCITLSDLPESPSRSRRPGIRKRATVSDLCASSGAAASKKAPMLKQHSAPQLLKYLPAPPVVGDYKDLARAGGTIPPPPSPETLRKQFAKVRAKELAE